MISLEDNMLPKLRSCLCNKHNSITSRKLNSYHCVHIQRLKKQITNFWMCSLQEPAITKLNYLLIE